MPRKREQVSMKAQVIAHFTMVSPEELRELLETGKAILTARTPQSGQTTGAPPRKVTSVTGRARKAPGLPVAGENTTLPATAQAT